MASHENVARMSTLALVRHLIDNLSKLVDREVELVKKEARETATETFRGATTLIVGAAFGLLSVVSLVVAGILALALIMPGWLAGIIAFVVFGIVATFLVLIGKGELEAVKERPLVRSRETLREDVQWARHHLTSSER